MACCLLLIFCHALKWRDSRFKPTPAIAGCGAGLLILVRPFDAAITLPLLAIYLLRQDWQRVWRERRFLNSNFGRFLIPAAISIVLVGLHNAVRFGNPMVFDRGVGFDTPLRVGLYGLLLSRGHGVLFFSPPVAATIPALLMMRRRRPAEALLFAAFIAVYPIAYATYRDWAGGLCWGPRYLVPALPFAVLPLGELLMMGGVAEALVLALGLAGLSVQLAATLVDFQRARLLFTDPSYQPNWLEGPKVSQILVHWRVLLLQDGKYLDWLPMRIYAAQGIAAAMAYAALPLGMMLWAIVGLGKIFRNADAC